MDDGLDGGCGIHPLVLFDLQPKVGPVNKRVADRIKTPPVRRSRRARGKD